VNHFHPSVHISAICNFHMPYVSHE
jgi:hypothetical protein